MAGTIDPEAFMALAAGLLAQVQQEQQSRSQSTASNSTPAVPRATTSQSFRNPYAHVIFIFLLTSFSKLQSGKMVVGGGSGVLCLCRKLLAKAVYCCCTQVKGTYAYKYSLLLLVVYT